MAKINARVFSPWSSSVFLELITCW